ncbi:hypothetical protein JL720_14496 [Aureococcus anophagefferens]|nr:hypothetical protein JL720_14496 [Aureococcus anophagefferens]
MEYDGGVGAALGNLDMDTPAKAKRAKPPPGPPPRGQAKKYAAPLAPANGAGLQTPKFQAFFSDLAAKDGNAAVAARERAERAAARRQGQGQGGEGGDAPEAAPAAAEDDAASSRFSSDEEARLRARLVVARPRNSPEAERALFASATAGCPDADEPEEAIRHLSAVLRRDADVGGSPAAWFAVHARLGASFDALARLGRSRDKGAAYRSALYHYEQALDVELCELAILHATADAARTAALEALGAARLRECEVACAAPSAAPVLAAGGCRRAPSRPRRGRRRPRRGLPRSRGRRREPRGSAALAALAVAIRPEGAPFDAKQLALAAEALARSDGGLGVGDRDGDRRAATRLEAARATAKLLGFTQRDTTYGGGARAHAERVAELAASTARCASEALDLTLVGLPRSTARAWKPGLARDAARRPAEGARGARGRAGDPGEARARRRGARKAKKRKGGARDDATLWREVHRAIAELATQDGDDAAARAALEVAAGCADGASRDVAARTPDAAAVHRDLARAPRLRRLPRRRRGRGAELHGRRARPGDVAAAKGFSRLAVLEGGASILRDAPSALFADPDLSAATAAVEAVPESDSAVCDLGLRVCDDDALVQAKATLAGDGDALVAFFAAGESLVGVALGHGGAAARVFFAPWASETRAKMGKYAEAARRTRGPKADAAAAHLAAFFAVEALVAGFGDRATDLAVVAEDDVLRVPFHALPLRAGRVLDRVSVRYGPSLAVLAALERSAARRRDLNDFGGAAPLLAVVADRASGATAAAWAAPVATVDGSLVPVLALADDERLRGSEDAAQDLHDATAVYWESFASDGAALHDGDVRVDASALLAARPLLPRCALAVVLRRGGGRRPGLHEALACGGADTCVLPDAAKPPLAGDGAAAALLRRLWMLAFARALRVRATRRAARPRPPRATRARDVLPAAARRRTGSGAAPDLADWANVATFGAGYGVPGAGWKHADDGADTDDDDSDADSVGGDDGAADDLRRRWEDFAATREGRRLVQRLGPEKALRTWTRQRLRRRASSRRRAAAATGSAKALKAKARDSLRDAGADEAAAKVKKSVERAGHAAREAVEAGAKEAAGQAAAAKNDVERALQDAKAKRGAAKAFKARLKESDAGTQDQRSSGACVVS